MVHLDNAGKNDKPFCFSMIAIACVSTFQNLKWKDQFLKKGDMWPRQTQFLNVTMLHVWEDFTSVVKLAELKKNCTTVLYYLGTSYDFQR